MGQIGNARKNSVTDDEVVIEYDKCKSVYQVERTLGISTSTIYRILERNGVQRGGLAIYRANAAKFRADTSDEIRKKYDAGASFADLVVEYGGTEYSIKTAIKRVGGVLRPVCPPLSIKERAEIIRLHNDGVSQLQISLKLNRSQSFISRVLRNNGFHHKATRGSSHPRWKGGRYPDSEYMRVWVDDDDEFACMRMSDRTILEHRLVMARKLGRPLLPTETVHHIDGCGTNNGPENLELRQGKHGKHVVMCCLECGSRNVGHATIGST